MRFEFFRVLVKLSRAPSFCGGGREERTNAQGRREGSKRKWGKTGRSRGDEGWINGRTTPQARYEKQIESKGENSQRDSTLSRCFSPLLGESPLGALCERV